jgi:hypothetical protein
MMGGSVGGGASYMGSAKAIDVWHAVLNYAIADMV